VALGTSWSQAVVPEVPAGWRPRYHVTGERNWINDPNGPIQVGGVYHLFYQANPAGWTWGTMVWGHASSRDLVAWKRHPLALTPGDSGADGDGCWSGCTREVDGRPAIYYTGTRGTDGERVESVCRAWGSEDLLEWTKDPGNPLIQGPPPELDGGLHRDPFLWRDDGGWHLLLGSGTTAGERHGRVLRYDSPDASTWSYGGVFFEGPRWLDGLDLGEHWECPQLVVDGEVALLLVSCQSPGLDQPLLYPVWFVGAIRDGRFQGELGGLVDDGDVLYAPAVCTDQSGRVLLWGWAQESAPLEQVRAFAHVGALSLPRELLVDRGRLAVRPVAELEGLRAERLRPVPAAADGSRNGVVLPASPQLELVAGFGGGGGRAQWTLTGGHAGAAEAAVVADLEAGEVRVTGTTAGRPRAPVTTLERRDRHRLRMFLDGSLLEVFVDDERALTTRVYPPGGVWEAARFQAGGGLEGWAVEGWALHADAVT
jgi:beta-fructofuranosidase